DRSPAMIIALLGIMKSGAAYLPIDPQLPKGRREYMLQNASAAYALTSRKYAETLSNGSRNIIIEDILAAMERFPVTFPKIDLSGADLVYILYTSGSTGQ